MTDGRWLPSVALTRREQFLVGRMKRTGKLFAFLRVHRHELFDESFQTELLAMYRDSGEGKMPVAPALLLGMPPVCFEESRGRDEALGSLQERV